jgi:hypothetical protein
MEVSADVMSLDTSSVDGVVECASIVIVEVTTSVVLEDNPVDKLYSSAFPAGIVVTEGTVVVDTAVVNSCEITKLSNLSKADAYHVPLTK